MLEDEDLFAPSLPEVQKHKRDNSGQGYTWFTVIHGSLSKQTFLGKMSEIVAGYDFYVRELTPHLPSSTISPDGTEPSY